MSNAARLANANRDTAVSPKPSSAHRRGSLGGNGQPFPSAAAAATAASVAATAAAAASAPAGPMGAKARKAARDAEERAAREQAAEEMSAHSYNEMLKKCELETRGRGRGRQQSQWRTAQRGLAPRAAWAHSLSLLLMMMLCVP